MSMAAAEFVRGYLERVVNERDVGAVDDLVSPEFRGSGFGWPADFEGLRRFYAEQAEQRPDWCITVEDTLEVGEWVAVRATAGSGTRRQVEWLSLFRIVDDRLVETRIVSLVELQQGPDPDRLKSH
jgi:predicted SnoaL-like aldol condensation-catalyzing enzyme